MPTPADREKALETALAQIDRQFGKGSVMRLGSDERAPVAVIPTGSIALDVALGIGGLPRGRIVEIYGPESSGKTTLTLHAIANAQKAGGIAAFIDAEHALDPEYAKKLGVDIDSLLVSQPDTGEQALEIADMLVRSGSIDLIVIDSVAALVPRAEIEGEMGDSHVGLQARLMSQALRKLTGGLSQTGTTMIFINQLREKIGVFFGSPETTSGGKALKFYASVRLDIRRIETLKDGTDAVGNRTRVKVVKNKMAPPFKQAEFDILYGVGISREGSLIDYGVEHEIVRKSGAWYTYDGDQLGQGKENARGFLLEHPEVADEIEKKILTKLGVGAAKPTAVPPIADAPVAAVGAADTKAPRSRPSRRRSSAAGRRRRRVPDAQGIGRVGPHGRDRRPDRTGHLPARRGAPHCTRIRAAGLVLRLSVLDEPNRGGTTPGPLGRSDEDDAESDILAAPDAERVSLRALTRRGLSQRELERTLRDRGIDDETIGVEVERLTRVGLIDDLALAQTLVATLQERKGLGRTAIAAELTRRLLAPTAIEYALELVDTGDELARAKEIARKRAAQLGSLDRDAAIRRLSAYLARRGYSRQHHPRRRRPGAAGAPATSVRFR